MSNSKKITISVIVIIFIFLVIVVSSSMTTINTGEVGVKLRFGQVTSVLQPGLNFVLPFAESVQKLETRVQKEEVPADAASKDLQSINVKGALNYSIEEDKVEELYKKIGLSYRERIIAPAIQESVKASTAQFTAEELITKRAEVKEKILTTLRSRLKNDFINVDDFSIIDFGFSAEFNKAIESKQTAQQNALKASNDLDRIKIEGEQSITKAKAEAEAQRQQIQSLTPEFLQKLWIEKWDGKLPQVQSSTGSIINLQDLTKKP